MMGAVDRGRRVYCMRDVVDESAGGSERAVYPRNSTGNFPEIRMPKSGVFKRRAPLSESRDNSRTIINI